MNQGQKTIAVGVAAVSVAVLLLAALAAWPELAREYHLGRLRRDPALLERMLADLSGARREAVRTFVVAGPGREALIRLFLREIDRGESRYWVRKGSVRNSLYDRQGAYLLTSKKWALISSLRWRKLSYSAENETSLTLARIIDCLPACGSDPFTLPEYEDLVFKVAEVQGSEDPATLKCAVSFGPRVEPGPFNDFPPQSIEGNPFSRMRMEGAREIRE